ncbi:MAG: hypothetical protein B7X34_02340, partial [Acidobacteriia bacterium 12-62-4]
VAMGYGWALDYDAMFLDGAVKRLVMPGNVSYVFGGEADGNFRNRDEPRFDGAVAREVSGNWQITYKYGSVWRFQPFAGFYGVEVFVGFCLGFQHGMKGAVTLLFYLKSEKPTPAFWREWASFAGDRFGGERFTGA